MNPTPITNANGKLLYWLLGLLGTVLTGSTTAWLTSIHTRTILHGEKIAVLESQMSDQHQQLNKIDTKLDRILEQKGK